MKRAFYIIVGFIILIQFIQVEKTNPKTNPALEIKAPKEVMAILKNSCYDCHSNQVRWPWYSNIAPFSWSIKAHVYNGRAWVNFSIWNSYTKKEKKQKLYEIYRAVYAAMPLSSYTYFHKDATLVKSQRELIRSWAKDVQ